MNKLAIVFGVLCSILIVAGCSKYNFHHIFPFDETLHDRSNKRPDIQGFECDLSQKEFDSVKIVVHRSYPSWKNLGEGNCFHSNGIAIGSDFFGKTTAPVLYAVGTGFDLDGTLPVIIYFSEKQKMLFFIAEDGML